MAHEHQERELKLVLDNAAYDQCRVVLGRRYGRPLRLAQENRFYDSADLHLRRHGCSLRLRRENGRVIATSKRHVSRHNGFHCHHEREWYLNAACWPMAVTEVMPVLHWLPIPPDLRPLLLGHRLGCLGGFANLRFEWRLPEATLALDCTTLPQGCDRELEIECSDEAAATSWRHNLAAWGLPTTAQTRTKIERWLIQQGADAGC